MNKKQSQIKDVIVIGAGASGMMAAITAARRGRSVLILEHMDKVGKKILATGNGKCNYTNEYMTAECYHGNQRLLTDIRSQFERDDAIAFFRELGIWPKAKNGYYYPNSGQALSVVEAMQMELKQLDIAVRCGCQVQGLAEDYVGFAVATSTGVYKARKVIVACGLLAAPKLGSDGSMIPVLKELGHRFVSIVPALCGFYASGMDFKKVSGVRCEAELTLEIDTIHAKVSSVDGKNAENHAIVSDTDAKHIPKERGELQLTDYGVSGIPVFQLSSQAAKALKEKKKVSMRIDFLPEIAGGELESELHRRVERAKTMPEAAFDARSGAEHRANADTQRMSVITLEQTLCGLLNQKLIPVLVKKAGIVAGMQVDRVDAAQLRKLTDAIKNYPVTLDKVRDFEFAQVCAGGIRTEELDTKTLESRLVPGLYFAGEILDVDGICGGYNLQWAWSSGFVAGSQI